jgi:alpha-beta hydrolase superfamily lysophospholipase
VLDAAITITCPVRLLHGLADPDVPWRVSLRLMERLASPDVQACLIEHGDHRLSRESDIARLLAIVGALVQALGKDL